jgi:sortase (surface protein transpeptidase)
MRAVAIMAVAGAVLFDAPRPSVEDSVTRAFGQVPAVAAPVVPSPAVESARLGRFAADPIKAAPDAASDPRPEVPVTSGLLSAADADPGAPPVRLRIPSLGVDAPVAAVGYAAGEMEIPPRADTVGWYRYGPAPGQPGSAVLAAHVAWRGKSGVFADLRLAAPGAVVEVGFADGTLRRFRVVALASYDKAQLPSADVFRRDGEAVLTLITCGGAFNPSLRSFEDNVVAYAVPIEEAFEQG